MKIAERFEKPAGIRRILLIQLGDIGDVVWSLPALRAVREAWPEAAVSLLLREGSGALLAASDRPPGLFEVGKATGGRWERWAAPLRLVLKLRRERFDLVFDLRGDERGGYMAFLTGAPIRAALCYASLPWPRNRLFTHLVASTGRFPAVGAADLSLGILGAFGIGYRSAVPELPLSEAALAAAARLLAGRGLDAGERGSEEEGDAGGGRGFVTLNPFSRWSYKEWDAGKWAAVVDWIWGEYRMPVWVVGAASERERAAALVSACSGRVRSLAGATTLAELAGVLAQSRLHIGVDSAAPHIAAAVGTPTVTLYGPSDWRYWAPPGGRHRVVTPELPCAPCHRKGCDGHGVSRCLETLAAERVQVAIGEALAAAGLTR